MFKDHNTDPTFHLLSEALRERPGLAPLVKTAKVGEEVRQSLPGTAFADADGRLFPVHTPEDAMLSSVYLEKQAGVPSHIRGRVAQAMLAYGTVLPEVVLEKVAASPEPTQYLIEDAKLLPYRGPGDIPQAEAALLRNRRKLRPTTLAKAASLLVKEASASGQDLQGTTLSLAGLTKCDPRVCADRIEARVPATREGGQYFSKLASHARDLPAEATRADLVKLAEAVSQLDELYSLTQHYGRKLHDPLGTVFNTKVAMGSTVDLAGTEVPLEALAAIPGEVYEDVLGQDLLGEVSSEGEPDVQELVQVIETLPLDLKKALLDVIPS